MARWTGGRRDRGSWRRPRGPIGCVVWILALLVILLLLSLIFGGFQKGSKVGSGSAPGHRFQAAAQEITLGRVAAQF
jgi:hypothetical protein